MFHIIQRAVYPKLSLCSELGLYFRNNQFVELNLAENKVNFGKFGKLHTDTYFNSISVGKWKRYTNIDNLNLSITFKGKIKLVWHLHRLHFSHRILEEVVLENKELSTVDLPLSFWPKLEDGLLSFDLEALEESEITDFSYFTKSEPVNHVKLGIVITHFNRQQYVLPALDRLKMELLDDSFVKSKVSIYVVDNSQNLPVIDGVNIIPNENLGGSGGFTRGLMHLKEQGSYTHCLFMDDDASCEVEGIKRTLSLLEFAKDKELAVGGAMLREIEMFRQFENGARFDGLCRPNKCGLDLRNIHDLLVNEQEEKIDYAGWWFFAFPLSKIQHYAFPYFVRGDDIGFGLVHKFNIVTLNGISSWQDDFALKQGPLPYYLDTRNHIMQHFHNLVDGGLMGIVKTTAKMVLRNLLTYHYETALASICAMEDTIKGSDFWRNNVNMAERRKEILNFVSAEKTVDIPFVTSSSAILGNPNEGRIVKLFRWATLNGHLLPKCFFKKGIVWQHKGFGGSLREIYRYNQVLYIHYPTQKGFILEHNKEKFFNYLFRYIKAIYILSKNYRDLRKEYLETYNELTGEKFWKKQFKQTI